MSARGRVIDLSSVSSSDSSVRSRAPAPMSPPLRPSFLPELTQSSPIPSGSTTAYGSSPFKSVADYLRPSDIAADPLANFRADSAAPPRTPSARPVLATAACMEEGIPGIEDVSESQWDSGGYGSKGSDESDLVERAELRRLARDKKRFEEKDEAERKRRKGSESREGRLAAELKARRAERSSRSVSAGPSRARNIQVSSSISRGEDGEDLDAYDQDMIDDEMLVSSEREGLDANSETSDSDREDREDEEEDGEFEARESGPRGSQASTSSTPIPTSLVTPHEYSAEEDGGDVHWTPSPMSPRTRARRKYRSSSGMPDHAKRVRKSRSPLLIEEDSGVEQHGDPGPSSSRSRRSRSSTRKAALNARAKTRHAIVLSDDEDGDYDPFEGGDREAFGRDYDRQVQKEEELPDETDGTDDDDDDGELEGQVDDEEMHDSYAAPPPPDVRASSTSATKRKYSIAAAGDAGPSRPPPACRPHLLPAIPDYDDEFDDLPMDGLDTIDLDDLGPPAGPSRPLLVGAAPPSARLSDLFSNLSPQRPTPASSRTPLADLPISNITPYGLSTSGPSKRSGLLQHLDRALVSAQATPSTSVSGSTKNASTRAAAQESADQYFAAEVLMDDYGFIPVSRMPPRWREFYQNHWRRGADKANGVAEPTYGYEEPAASVRGGKASRARGGGRGGGTARARAAPASSQVATQRHVRRDVANDLTGDLGGPSAPSEGKGRGGKSWYAKRGGWAKKRGAGKRK